MSLLLHNPVVSCGRSVVINLKNKCLGSKDKSTTHSELSFCFLTEFDYVHIVDKLMFVVHWWLGCLFF